MSRDLTLQEKIEATLYTAGVLNSGEIAECVIDCIADHMAEDPEDLLIRCNRILQGVDWDG